MSLPLFERFPAIERKLYRVALGTFPTAVQKLEQLGANLHCDSLWIKRDDLSGELFGGNKVRALEFALGKALAEGKKGVVAYGVTGSHWVTACTIYAKQNGLWVYALLLSRPLDEQREGNFKAVNALADKVVIAKNPFAVPIHLASLRLKNSTLSVMPAGGTSPLTILGYVNAALELKHQIDGGLLPSPDIIFCPLGTGGTLAGLFVGLKLVGLRTKLIGVRTTDLVISNKLLTLWLAGRTESLLRRLSGSEGFPTLSRCEISITHRFIGDGYGIPSPEGTAAVHLMSDLEGITLDATYTGKTMAALMDFVKIQNVKDKTILYWHTLNSRRLTSAGLLLSQGQAKT